MIKPEIVIVHCSATPDFKPSDSSFDKFGAEDIHQWHLQRGFTKIGYTYVIRRTGEIQEGRKVDIINGLVEMGAHCRHQNDKSIGICYIGTNNPTDQQLSSFIVLYQLIHQIFRIDRDFWFPHNAFNPNKTCPGFDLKSLKKMFLLP